jgi:hypothetical protein
VSSQQRDPPGGFDFMRMWSDMAAKMMQTQMPEPPRTSADAMRETRSAMLDTWAEAWDQFLRSPQFLEMMRQSMAGSVQWRQQINDFLGNLQHQFQGVSRQDIDQVMLSMRHLEQRMVDSMEDIAAAIDDLGRRLNVDAESGEGSESVGNNGPRRKPKRKSSPHRNRREDLGNEQETEL